jgi:hypothetical protein
MAKSTFPGTLSEGATKPPVKTLKNRLNAIRSTTKTANQPHLHEDDHFGQLTELRVEQFQRHHNLAVDGVVGPGTWAKLFAEPIAHITVNGERAFPNVVVRHNVVCQSSRAAPISLIVVHDTEGANIHGIADLQGLGNFFNNPAVEASSHVATDADGTSARFVDDTHKAWHVAAFNSIALGIEQIGFASQGSWPDAQLRETARWIAYWSHRWKIPLTFSTSHGVCRHSDLGVAGGGHHDPGGNFPFQHTLDLAAHYAALQAS